MRKNFALPLIGLFLIASAITVANLGFVPRRIPTAPVYHAEDLGVLPAGIPVRQTFRITNSGNSRIELDNDVDVTCGCTAGVISSQILDPLESITLDLIINIPSNEVNKQTISARLYARESGVRVIKAVVVVSFATRMQWKLIPSEIRTVGRPGSRQSATYRMFTGKSPIVSIKDVRLSIADMESSWSFERLARTDTETTISLEGSMPSTPGVYIGSLDVITTDVAIPAQSAKLILEVIDDLTISPRKMLILIDKKLPTMKRTMIVKSERPTKIIRIDSNHNFISSELLNSNQYRLIHSIDIRMDDDKRPAGSTGHKLNIVYENEAGEVRSQTYEVLVVKSG